MLLRVKIKMKAALSVLLTILLYGQTACLVREHHYLNKPMTWHEAQVYCRSNFDDLSTFLSQEELKQLVGLIPCIPLLTCTTSEWIGQYTDTPTQSNPIWKWSGGDSETLCTWASNEPNNMPDEACVMAYDNVGECYNAPCSANHSFFCMDVYEVVLVQENKTWQKALDYCREHYIDLVSLKASNWMQNAVKVSKEAQTAYVWTGLRFLSGHWLWANGDDLVYQAWSTEGQPQCPAPNRRCVSLGQKEETWQPRDCEEKLNFLCFREVQYDGSVSATSQTSSSTVSTSTSTSTSSSSTSTEMSSTKRNSS